MHAEDSDIPLKNKEENKIMGNFKEIITIASACLGLLATVTGFLIPLVKNVKAKNKLSAINKLTVTLQSLVVDAEKFADFTGAEKKEYVMTKINRYAIENKIPYDEQAVSEKIEDLVALSKEVNKRETAAYATKSPDSVTSIKI